MKNKRRLPELLAPAGDMEALFAAVKAGADAIYVGGRRFGARAFAKNFDNEELIYAVRYCHIHGVRLYVTLNTLVFDKEIDEMLEYARFLSGIGVDAVIVADVGAATLIRKKIPGLELHGSTQMGIHNTPGADEAHALGISRVVLARECSLEDIRLITERAKAECEVFVHGALCVCHSGQCLFSSMVGGRSGNRGECAQPCRLPYGSGYTLSLRDLSLARHVRELVSAGVSSLKIEGRMKSADYVYRVVSIYRALLDESRDASDKEMRSLADIFSRGGFTDGYFKGELRAMTGVRSEEEKRISRELSGETFEKTRAPIFMKARILRGEPSRLSVVFNRYSRWDGSEEKIELSVSGAEPFEAINAPLSPSDVKARLSKLGATDFKVDEAHLELSMDEGVILPVSELNRLRREATDALYAHMSEPIKNEAIASASLPEINKNAEIVNKSAQFFDVSALAELLAKKSDALKNIDAAFVPLFDYSSLAQEYRGKILGVSLPVIVMERELDEVKAQILAAVSAGAKYALLGNISHLSLVDGTGLIPVADQRMNVANAHTGEYLRSRGVYNRILSAELTLPMARDIGGALTVLGRMPLMVTERCFVKENFGCKKCMKAELVDRMGKRFPILREWRHRNIIFNSVPTYMGDKKDELRAARIRSEHFVFTSESADTIAKMLRAYERGEELTVPVSRIKRKIGAK